MVITFHDVSIILCALNSLSQLPCKTTLSYSRYFFPGHYSSGGATSCTQCTAGHFCTSTTQTACGATKYSSAGATSCSDCPAGHQCSSTTTSTPIQCLAGTYSGPAAASCTTCDKGYQCPLDGATAPEACGNGTYAPTAGATTCTPCPAGMFHVYQQLCEYFIQMMMTFHLQIRVTV